MKPKPKKTKKPEISKADVPKASGGGRYRVTADLETHGPGTCVFAIFPAKGSPACEERFKLIVAKHRRFYEIPSLKILEDLKSHKDFAEVKTFHYCVWSTPNFVPVDEADLTEDRINEILSKPETAAAPAPQPAETAPSEWAFGFLAGVMTAALAAYRLEGGDAAGFVETAKRVAGVR